MQPRPGVPRWFAPLNMTPGSVDRDMSRSTADGLTLVRAAPGASRDPYVPLLLLADEPEPLRGYLNDGDLYVLRDAEGQAAGVTLVLP